MKRRLLLVFLIDALGYELTQGGRWFEHLGRRDGPVESVCGYSSACIPSILTGLLPAQHGHWAMYLRDPARSVFRRYKPIIWLLDGLLRRPYATRRVLSRWLRRSGITGYFSLYEIPPRLLPQFDLCEKRSIFEPGGISAAASVFDIALRLGLRWRSWYWKSPEEENRRQMLSALEEGRDDFLFFYTPRLDALMHAHGTRAPEVATALEDLDGFIAHCLEVAHRRYGEVRALVFGDHGMADVLEVHDIMTSLEALGLRVPRDLLWFVDSTMARFWFFDPAARDKVESVLEDLDFGRILDAEEMERLGIRFSDDRYGEMVFLLREGHILVPSFTAREPVAAMHGYHPEEPGSATVVFSNFEHELIGSITTIGRTLVAQLQWLLGEA